MPQIHVTVETENGSTDIKRIRLMIKEHIISETVFKFIIQSQIIIFEGIQIIVKRVFAVI